ncbi:hypothetical protein LXT21_44480 [Myxococcus sp. K38C18041901]|uniref:CC0125/CC1285 family lipoprotein n=1 Tax=Myxococcus guangdongensis TaxID=2906760 RepID=UPI0020A7671B|nr:hypothetical protein [Myxococcus guangdongensis]MCP3065848.1 hypothetical protein [Myxococcus guangdongensis]
MRLAPFIALLALAGCTTPYQRMGFAGGYRDTEVAPGVIRVEVRGNAYTSIETLEQYFHKRAGEICSGRKYDWRMDSGASNDPSSWTARQVGRSVTVTETPGFRKGWVTGVIACEGKQQVAKTTASPSPDKMQILDVASGRVANVSADIAMAKVPGSKRFAFVSDGKVEALTPEGHRVQVSTDKLDAAKALGYRFLSDAALERTDEAPRAPNPSAGADL